MTATLDTKTPITETGTATSVRNLTDDHIDALLDRLECEYYYEISNLVSYVNSSHSLDIPAPDKWTKADESQFYDLVVQCADCDVYLPDVGSELSEDGPLCTECFMHRAIDE